MPAEWEKHQATWLSWPKDPNTFPPDILPSVESTFAEMVGALEEGEEVWVLVDDAKTESRVASLLKRRERVSFHRLKTVDVWVRDYGPTYVKGRDLALVKWVFNAWGNKYEDLEPDNEAGERIANSSGLEVFRPGIVLEGGSIDVNGRGCLVTTEQCLLNPNRNPKLGKRELEAVLRDYLGVGAVIWLGRGIEGDDTDGHVDDVARFAGPRSLTVAVEPDATDRNHAALEENRRLLVDTVDKDGHDFDVVGIPMPGAIGNGDGRLPASHLNFYVGNSCLLVPTFGGESDRKALKALEGLFPRREVVGIDCRALVYGLGTLHCVTQQVPSVD